MEHKTCGNAQIKIFDQRDGKSFGRIAGYASTWDNWDRVMEKPARGAFAKSLDKFMRDGFIAVGHDWTLLPVATPDLGKEDNIGLYLEADFHSTPFAQEARTISTERIERGKSVSFSIGYEVKDAQEVEIDDPTLNEQGITKGRILTEINLFEVSLVNVPANPLATATGIKSMLQASMAMDAHSEVVQAAIEGYVQRLTGLSGTRTKEGRVLSSQNRTKLSDLHASLADVMQAIEELLAATEPKAPEEEVRKALAAFFVRQAKLQGVTH